jgi:hypothetical protein
MRAVDIFYDENGKMVSSGENYSLKIIMLIADEGMIITDGNNFGTTIMLARDRSADEFHEITLEEYEKILNAETEMVLE